MGASITIHGFETSNNIKVRVALGYKRLAYDFVEIDPKERGALVRLSGQHLTPVMQHGEVVLFDSAAIMRYLDANFRDTPRLYGSSLLEQWRIEDEEFFARTVLAGPVMDVVHDAVETGAKDEARAVRAEEAMARALDQLAARLERRSWLVGDSMTAADIAAAAVIQRVRVGGLFALPASVSAIEEWCERVLAFDRYRRPGGV